jgi:hypothetical protein
MSVTSNFAAVTMSFIVTKICTIRSTHNSHWLRAY